MLQTPVDSFVVGPPVGGALPVRLVEQMGGLTLPVMADFESSHMHPDAILVDEARAGRVVAVETGALITALAMNDHPGTAAHMDRYANDGHLMVLFGFRKPFQARS